MGKKQFLRKNPETTIPASGVSGRMYSSALFPKTGKTGGKSTRGYPVSEKIRGGYK